MNWLLIAGGVFFTPSPVTLADEEIINHTLVGDPVPAVQVVTRNRWGTPMLPDGKAGYNITMGVVPAYIAQSLIQPPITSGPIFRPNPETAVP